MWIDRCWVAEHFAEHLEKLKTIRLEWFMLYHNIGAISSRPFYLPWVAFREYGDWCDSLGNLLAILTGVADGHRTEHILRYMHQVGLAEPYPTKAIYPPIYPGESDWREYYRSRNLNLPHQYHNGGIWPLIGGFHVAALVRHGWQDEALESLLVSLAEANRQGIAAEWEFNEWLHGEHGHPMGFGEQAWSAAMYLYADNAVNTGALPLFDDLRGRQTRRSRGQRKTTRSTSMPAEVLSRHDSCYVNVNTSQCCHNAKLRLRQSVGEANHRSSLESMSQHKLKEQTHEDNSIPTCPGRGPALGLALSACAVPPPPPATGAGEAAQPAPKARRRRPCDHHVGHVGQPCRSRDPPGRGRRLHGKPSRHQRRDHGRAVERLLHQDPNALGQRRLRRHPRRALPVAHAPLRGRRRPGESGLLHRSRRL